MGTEFDVLLATAGIHGVSAETGGAVGYPQRPVTLFNHAVFVSRVVGLDNVRVVEVDGEATVTLPDHPFEPVRLGAGTWLMEHPFPSNGRVD